MDAKDEVIDLTKRTNHLHRIGEKIGCQENQELEFIDFFWISSNVTIRIPLRTTTDGKANCRDRMESLRFPDFCGVLLSLSDVSGGGGIPRKTRD